MELLAPWALVWLGGIPVLLWLWRLSSTHRQVRVASLIPFEHLLKRAPKRRTRLVVTLLFWLQLAALLGLAFAVSRPVLFQRRAHTRLVILDTSASMGSGGAFEQARGALLVRLARKGPADQVFVMTTSPVAPLTPQPTSDAVAVTRLVQELRPAPMGGNLATTAHLGRVLLGREPDETLVVTDEARPETLPDGVSWVTVGRPAPNAAIVGLDAVGPLCGTADAGVVVTVQNFSEAALPVKIAASQGSRRLAEASAQLPPGGRQSLSLAIPPDAGGSVEVILTAPDDGLAADNRAWFTLQRAATLPIVVRSASAALTKTVSSWLGACETLAFNADGATAGALVVTDGPVPTDAAASLVFEPPAAGTSVLSYWVVSSGHPIGSYLAPVEAVAASLNLSAEGGVSGVPVVAALLQGRKVPVVVAEESQGRRTVTMRLDPSSAAGATPVLLAFFNSVRWLLERPDAPAEANFFDPLESNLLRRPSTWRDLPPMAASPPAARRVAHPLSSLLILAALALLLAEWWRYCARRAG